MSTCKWCGLAIPPAPYDERTCGGPYTCTHRQAYEEGEEQGRADERAAVVAWLRDHDVSWVAGLADRIERGEHVDEGKGKP